MSRDTRDGRSRDRRGRREVGSEAPAAARARRQLSAGQLAREARPAESGDVSPGALDAALAGKGAAGLSDAGRSAFAGFNRGLDCSAEGVSGALRCGDFHDRVIARIFTAGLLLQTCRQVADEPDLIERIDGAAAELDEAVRQLRTGAFDAKALCQHTVTVAAQVECSTRPLDPTTPRSQPRSGANMPRRSSTKTRTVKVSFSLPAEVEADDVALCGEFNDWSTTDTKLTRDGQGSWQATVHLEPGRAYRYRYLLDGERWENSWEADDYTPNPYGSDDSVVDVIE